MLSVESDWGSLVNSSWWRKSFAIHAGHHAFVIPVPFTAGATILGSFDTVFRKQNQNTSSQGYNIFCFNNLSTNSV